MDSIVVLIIIAIIVWILNFTLGLIQIRDFNKNYIELRKLGKVAIGRKKGMFTSGTIVLLRIENDGFIVESRKMQGVTVAARVRNFQGLENMYIDNLEEETLKKFNKPLKKAILDAVKNYKTFKMEEGSLVEAEVVV